MKSNTGQGRSAACEEMQEFACRFSTEKINLPRGKVFGNSLESSPTKNDRDSPLKMSRVTNVVPKPDYTDKQEYLKEYWKLYL